jgi:arsenate reductase
MAAAMFNSLADPGKARAVSAGTAPAERVHPEVVTVMREVGIDLSGASPRRLTADFAQSAVLLITMGCGDECPLVPGVRRDDWPLQDPKGQSMDAVRRIRDEVRQRVERLVLEEGWRTDTTSAIERPHSRIVRDPMQPARSSGSHERSPDRIPRSASMITTDLERAPPIVDARCCKTCISFDNPSIGHGRCMKRPTTPHIEYNSPRVLVDASNICDWHEEVPGVVG